MSWTDIATASSTIATIIAAIFTVLAFFKRPSAKGATTGRASKASILSMAVLALVSWIAVAFDYFERHSRPFAYNAVLNQWGVAAPLSYFLEANVTALAEYKSSERLMLILRVPYAEADRMSDRIIEKSRAYTITGNAVMLAHPTSNKLRFMAFQPTPVEFNLVMIPNAISEDQINCLEDVEHVGGRILATTATNVVGGPPDQQQPPK